MEVSGERLRIGVTGLGGFGRQHMAAWAAVPTAHIVAICDVRADARAAMAERYGIETQYTTYEDVLHDERVEAVDIVTNADRHPPQVLAAIAAGKHVFCEKPLAESADEAQRLVDAARQAGVRLQVGFVSRFGIPYAVIKEQLDAGLFGDLLTIRAKRNIPRSWAPSFQQAHIAYETAVHDLDLIVWYAGSRCKSVYAQQRSYLDLTYPDLFMAMLTFESGVVASVECGWTVPAGAPTGIIGAWDVGGILDAELEVIGTRQSARYTLSNSALNIWTEQRTYYPELELFPNLHGQTAGAIREELAHFVACVRSGRDSAVAPAQDAVAGLRIADAIIRSAQSGEIVSLD